MSERRYNPLADEWIVITADRQERVFRPPTEQCPLCPIFVNRDGFTEIPFEEYEVAIFENRFPALTVTTTTDSEEYSLPYETAPAYGHCEVVAYSDDHGQTFADLPVQRIRLVIDAWIDRCETLGLDPDVHYVMPFENKGELIGATLGHPHGQIYAFPEIPPRVGRHVTTAHRYFGATERCIQCDVYSREIESGDRLVMNTSSWLVFVPFAPQFPFELHIVPKRHVPSLSALNSEEKHQLAHVLSAVTKCYDQLWNISLPYVMAIHQRPTDDEQRWDDFCHVRFEFKPMNRDATKIKYLAGVELSAGTFVVDIRPEDAAEQLRRAM
jgi:UDPglucose--hexose-1-phosphate uridylyltransferase